MSRKPFCRTFTQGYLGQRFEVVAKRPPEGSPQGVSTEWFVVGWTDQENGGALVRVVKEHPVWREPVVYDLGENDDDLRREPGAGLLKAIHGVPA